MTVSKLKPTSCVRFGAGKHSLEMNFFKAQIAASSIVAEAPEGTASTLFVDLAVLDLLQQPNRIAFQRCTRHEWLCRQYEAIDCIIIAGGATDDKAYG